MGLFDTKKCCICEAKVTNQDIKLKDGYVCVSCAQQFSPYYQPQVSTTIQQIKEHIAYRHNNKILLESFAPTKILGGITKVYIDEPKGLFIVSDAEDYRQENPDVLRIDQIFSVQCDVKEIYNDPIEYQFQMKLLVNSPWFDRIAFLLIEGKNPDDVNGALYQRYEAISNEIERALMPKSFMSLSIAADPIAKEEYDPWKCSCGTFNTGSTCTYCGKGRPGKWFCPNCGKENDGNACISCGTKRPSGI